MCGICGTFFGDSCCVPPDRAELLHAIAHRGPDGASLISLAPRSFLGFSRLSLVGDAQQPFVDGAFALVCNGEIYNHEELRLSMLAQHPLAPVSDAAAAPTDCSILLQCFTVWGLEESLRRLDGMFALALVSTTSAVQDVFLARDRMGVKPLLWGLCGARRCLAFGSEAAALPATWHVADVAPGHLVHIRISAGAPAEVVRDALFLPQWHPSPQRDLVTCGALRAALVSAVEAQLVGDHPVGVMLSGGLDSSVLAAVAARLYRQRGAAPLEAFTIAHVAVGEPAPDSADLISARLTAEYVGANLSCFTFNTAEALAVLGDVIAHMETYDVGVIRVAVPLFLLAKKVAASGCRAVLVGEGADEVFGGYALFQPYSREALPEFQRELERRLACISVSELLKVDRCTMAFGVEARVPFLDAAFLSLAMHDSCAERKLSHPSTGRLEKSLLRDAFAGGWLPDDVLWRRKEGMADGVGFQWIREVQCEAVRLEAIGDPRVAEAALYKRIFNERATPSRIALAQARIAARNAGRPGPLASLVSGSEFIRNCKSVRDDPQLCDLFTRREAVLFCSSALGVNAATQPLTLELLNALIEAVLQRVPFHNFSMLVRPRVPPTRDEVRDDWLRCLGGTCAFTSPAFAAMLCALGFQVFLVASIVRREFDHLALLVLVGGRFHYVDVGNGKRYLEAAPLGEDRPLGCASSFTWRVRWDVEAARFHVIHGSLGEDGETLWNAAPSVTFDPQHLVHYSFFHEHFARARLDAANVFLHGLRFAVFPRLDAEATIRDAMVTLGSASRIRTRSEDELLAVVKPMRMNGVQMEYLQMALARLRQQRDDLWSR